MACPRTWAPKKEAISDCSDKAATSCLLSFGLEGIPPARSDLPSSRPALKIGQKCKCGATFDAKGHRDHIQACTTRQARGTWDRVHTGNNGQNVWKEVARFAKVDASVYPSTLLAKY
eukprot:3941361-Rhodomonas_salina.1